MKINKFMTRHDVICAVDMSLTTKLITRKRLYVILDNCCYDKVLLKIIKNNLELNGE